jgi:hypothetical protein
LPAIVEADDEGMYVLKFRGAGQGPKALIAELVAGELARAIGLPVPEIVFMKLDADLARTEPDPEIQQLIQDSAGMNLALDYLPGAVTFDPLVTQPDVRLASAIVWFDAFVTNVDRTARNTNMLMWHRQLWLIDHGAALYFHHSWDEYRERSRDAFAMIRHHVLLRFASALQEVGEELTARTRDTLEEIVAWIPEAWLVDAPFASTGQHRAAYVDFLTQRLEPPQAFLKEAIRALPV